MLLPGGVYSDFPCGGRGSLAFRTKVPVLAALLGIVTGDEVLKCDGVRAGSDGGDLGDVDEGVGFAGVDGFRDNKKGCAPGNGIGSLKLAENFEVSAGGDEAVGEVLWVGGGIPAVKVDEELVWRGGGGVGIVDAVAAKSDVPDLGFGG